MMLRYCANLKAIRYESTSLNRTVADKSHRVIVALDVQVLDKAIHLDRRTGKESDLPWITVEIHQLIQQIVLSENKRRTNLYLK